VDSGAPAERQVRSRELVKAAMCVARAIAVPRAGVESLERVGAAAAGAAAASRVAGAAAAVASAVAVAVAAVGVAVAVAAVGAGVDVAGAFFLLFASLDYRSAQEEMQMCRGSRNFANCAPVWCRRLTVVVVLCFVLMGPVSIASGAAARQQSFPSPEAGVQALLDAAKSNDTKTILQILGPEAKSIVDTGDPAATQASLERFVKSYEEAHTLVPSGDTKVVLQIGKDEWPFPIPLIKDSAGWFFDTPQGKAEILNRRIGRNELDVIQVCLAYVDAQREYYTRNPQNAALLQYAQKFVSTKGKRDGLYWETSDNEPPSPLGPLVAQARRKGYKRAAGKPMPYHGYYYKMLTGQGADAPDGAYDYVVRGKMIGGFALVTYPAQYGSSGIMTFIVNHDGVVYEKDLGPNTAATAQSMTKFNPDKTWKKL
jgi:DUF2950 family protein